MFSLKTIKPQFGKTVRIEQRMSWSCIHQKIFFFISIHKSGHPTFPFFFFFLLTFQLAIAKNNIIKLQEENHQLRSENTLILMKTQHHLEVW